MKKLIVAVISAVLLLTMCSCSKSQRMDWQELSKRLADEDEKYSYSFLDLVFYDGAYHTFLSLHDKDDAILSMTSDGGMISSVTLTASSRTLDKSDGREEFYEMCKALCEVFAGENDDEAEKICKSIYADTTDRYFSECYKTYETEHYKYIFSSNNLFISFCCEYYDSETVSMNEK